ncbi:MAG: ribosomal protein L7/L12 [Novosphingobium sp.]|nr:ribosomal protein L7/L12 [Novosphingobium sp.]
MLSAFQDATWQAIAWTAAIFLLGFIFGKRTGGGRDLSGPPPMSEEPPPPLSAPEPEASGGGFDSGVRALIEAELTAGHKIEAIKLLREATGMGLKDAKEAVEDGSFRHIDL